MKSRYTVLCRDHTRPYAPPFFSFSYFESPPEPPPPAPPIGRPRVGPPRHPLVFGPPRRKLPVDRQAAARCSGYTRTDQRALPSWMHAAAMLDFAALRYHTASGPTIEESHKQDPLRDVGISVTVTLGYCENVAAVLQTMNEPGRLATDTALSNDGYHAQARLEVITMPQNSRKQPQSYVITPMRTGLCVFGLVSARSF